MWIHAYSKRKSMIKDWWWQGSAHASEDIITLNVWSGNKTINKIVNVITVPISWAVFPTSGEHFFSCTSVEMGSAGLTRAGLEVGSACFGIWYLNFSPFLSGSKKCIRASTWMSLCFSLQENMKLFLPSIYYSLNCTQTILRAQGEITNCSSCSLFL